MLIITSSKGLERERELLMRDFHNTVTSVSIFPPTVVEPESFNIQEVAKGVMV